MLSATNLSYVSVFTLVDKTGTHKKNAFEVGILDRMTRSKRRTLNIGDKPLYSRILACNTNNSRGPKSKNSIFQRVVRIELSKSSSSFLSFGEISAAD